MVVLMTGERCTASECLLTVGVRALVWALAGMDSAMSGKGTGITEWLRES
jgi:hypothetical protein